MLVPLNEFCTLFNIFKNLNNFIFSEIILFIYTIKKKRKKTTFL
jgi:hypothetical protein